MINKNEIYEINITGMGSDGEGVGKIDGFAVFVSGALTGETVRVLIVKVLKNYAYGKLMEIITPSPNRTESECPHFPKCGGCTLHHCDYEFEKAYKTQKVADCILRIGKIDTPVLECIGCDDIYAYRNKAIFPVTSDGVGFFAPRSHRVIPVEKCLIQSRITDEAVACVKDFMRDYNIPPYDEKSHKGVIRNIFIRCGFSTGELMVAVVTRTNDLPHKDELVKALRDRVNPTSVIQNINTEKTNVAIGEKSITLYGTDFIRDKIGETVFEISLNSFFQINPLQTKVLYDKVVEFADFKGGERVFDLYCGAGTISLYIAPFVKEVIGVECVAQAIENAKRNAEINGINNAKFYTGNAEEVTPNLGDADVVVVDPPRKGCDETLLKTVAEINPQKIIYVSCNPATLARDLQILTDYGFTAEKIQPVDMFPRTAHVECVVLMSRVEN
jgi:23S rRNA (uracil1939-C5)-methyltransferase